MTVTATHPLDPLTAAEIEQAVATVRREQGAGENWRFAVVELREPAKPSLAGADVAREASVICWDRTDGAVYEAVVSLSDDALVSWRHVPGVQPRVTIDEFHECDHVVRAHAGFRAKLAERGITDLDNVLVDAWTFGSDYIPEQYRDRRVVWTTAWVRASEKGNPYAGPVENLFTLVDLNTMEVLEIEDHGAVAAPEVRGEYMPHLLDMPLRDDVKPYHVTQPEGPSFTVDGWEVRWQKWRMRIGFNVREGLVLHTVGYEDGGRLRPIAHRMSFAELVVPYGDPSPGQYRRTAFDIGEWGFGELTNSLELGCDCLGEIRYFDVPLANSKGEAYTIKNAVCLHEEDAGLLWKHVDPVAGTETRRMRRLVVSFVVTVANYEYLVYWRFYQDGSIECEVRLTGIPIVAFFSDGEAPPYGALVDERTYAPYHQHLIVARLDLDVDGEQNTVYEVHSEAAPAGPDNPYGTAMIAPATPLRSESEAQQSADPSSQRYWKVVNHGSLNRLGQPVAYKLLPSSSPPAFVAPDSPAMRRAAVIGKHLWVTPFERDERFPCGDYPNQSAADTGLPVWTAADRSLEDTDVVLWHVFGAHHVTRPEDWPMMPVEIVGFWLKPVGFFDRSPALDVPHSH